MRAQTLPAVAGWRWLTGGFAIFRRNPPLMSLLVISYWFTLLFLKALAMLVPVVGAVAVSLLVPGLSVGLMQACRDLERGEPVGLQTLYGGIRQNPRTLMLLGLVNMVAMLGIFGFASLADGGEFFRILGSGEQPSDEVLSSGRLLLPTSIILLLMTPLLMAYWYAPMLAAWHRLPVLKSLFFSLVSCWLNWRAFLVYALGIALVGAILPGMLLGTLVLMFPAAQGFLSALFTAPMVLVMAPVLFASFYVSYRDVFMTGISESA